MKCPNCGLINVDNAMWCDCGYDFQTGAMRAKCPRCGLINADRAVRCDCGYILQPGTLDRSEVIFQREIDKCVRKGFRVVNQTRTTAQLVRGRPIDEYNGWEEAYLIAFEGWPPVIHTPFDEIRYDNTVAEELFLAIDPKGHIGRRRRVVKE